MFVIDCGFGFWFKLWLSSQGIGWSTESKDHRNADMIGAWFDNGDLHCIDTFSEKQDDPPLDKEQNLENCEGEVSGGW